MSESKCPKCGMAQTGKIDEGYDAWSELFTNDADLAIHLRCLAANALLHPTQEPSDGK